MQLIRGVCNIRPEHKGCVLTIGKFDGVHLGHRAVFENLINKASEMGLPTAVMVFEPQPEELFSPANAPARLSNLRDKYEQLRQIGINRLICIRFNYSFAALSPEAFVQNLLVDKLGTRFLVVGDDFRFGKNRKGDFTFLQNVAPSSGFRVVSTASYRMDNCRISSTAIRSALEQNEFNKARQMLGRDFSLFGRVVHGEKNGRSIGFPTANLLVKQLKAPVNGVFAVTAEVAGSKYYGVANLGVRPTLAGKRLQLETHLFDFNKDIYGHAMRVNFLHKIRDEQKFAGLDELMQQIEHDSVAAKSLLGLL